MEVWVEDPDGERLTSVPQHQRVTLKARVAFMVDVTDPAASVYVYNDEHRAVLVATTWIDNERSGQLRAPARRSCSRSLSTTSWPLGATRRCSSSRTAAPAWT